jgi:hypothetical protein
MASLMDNARLLADCFWLNAMLLFRAGKLEIFFSLPLDSIFPRLRGASPLASSFWQTIPPRFHLVGRGAGR